MRGEIAEVWVLFGEIADASDAVSYPSHFVRVADESKLALGKAHRIMSRLGAAQHMLLAKGFQGKRSITAAGRER